VLATHFFSTFNIGPLALDSSRATPFSAVIIVLCASHESEASVIAAILQRAPAHWNDELLVSLTRVTDIADVTSKRHWEGMVSNDDRSKSKSSGAYL
jgi:hypothetical protein